ncbi:MAG TPA: hypothetical protein VG323_08190 [Thermoanaerobaculia bacterium]|nr:hypothetical protein [Thermoanaerobaculia bacterium]
MAAKAVSDEAVKRATGRDWAEWMKLLDKAGAKKKSHREIAAMVSEKYGAPSWWSQMVTVHYERERGLREVHQTATGYSASVSKTFDMPVEKLFEKFRRAAKKAKYAERKATAPKSLRLNAPDETSVEAGFYAKGEKKSSVAVQHSKLSSQKDVKKRKDDWREVLDSLG